MKSNSELRPMAAYALSAASSVVLFDCICDSAAA